jgi:hypothetical protein
MKGFTKTVSFGKDVLTRMAIGMDYVRLSMKMGNL